MRFLYGFVFWLFIGTMLGISSTIILVHGVLLPTGICTEDTPHGILVAWSAAIYLLEIVAGNLAIWWWFRLEQSFDEEAPIRMIMGGYTLGIACAAVVMWA